MLESPSAESINPLITLESSVRQFILDQQLNGPGGMTIFSNGSMFIPIPTQNQDYYEMALALRDMANGDTEDQETARLLLGDIMDDDDLSLEGAQLLMRDISPANFGLPSLEDVPTVEAEAATPAPTATSDTTEPTPTATPAAAVDPTTKKKLTGSQKRAARAARAAKNAEKSAAEAGAGGGKAAETGGAGAGAGGKGSRARGAPPMHPKIEQKLEDVSNWKSAVNFLIRNLGWKRKSGSSSGSHRSFTSEEGKTVKVAKPHTDKAKTHFAKRFMSTIRGILGQGKPKK